MVDPDQPGLWERVEGTHRGLPEACGCFVFGVRTGGGQKPWYVGQANKRAFRHEVFADHKLKYYTDVVLNQERGSPVVYLVARSTPTQRLSRPSEVGYRDIDALELILIGQALRRNPDLCNKKATRLYRDMMVHGVMNSAPGNRGTSALGLRLMMGIGEDP